jgi:hypothetical protein
MRFISLIPLASIYTATREVGELPDDQNAGRKHKSLRSQVKTALGWAPLALGVINSIADKFSGRDGFAERGPLNKISPIFVKSLMAPMLQGLLGLTLMDKFIDGDYMYGFWSAIRAGGEVYAADRAIDIGFDILKMGEGQALKKAGESFTNTYTMLVKQAGAFKTVVEALSKKPGQE